MKNENIPADVKSKSLKEARDEIDDILNKLESKILKDLDPDKLSDLSEVLYAFNNYKVGPMDGFYMAVEVVSGTKWCVGQLCADRAKPLKLFEDKLFDTPEAAQKAAEKMKEETDQS